MTFFIRSLSSDIICSSVVFLGLLAQILKSTKWSFSNKLFFYTEFDLLLKIQEVEGEKNTCLLK